MASLNKVFLMGNLTRDPELRYTPKGTAIASFGMAINRKWKTETGDEKEDVCFVDVDAWARQAEVCSQYLSKGSPLFVEGELRYDQWDDKATGQKRSKLKVRLINFQFIGAPKGGRAGEGGEGGESRPSSRKAAAAPAPTADASDDAPPAGEKDDIPF